MPGMWQVVRHGVPDQILTTDRAILELRTLNAAHGAQLVGPYSRFSWSQPGPAYFYLALPFYAAFHKRGSALSLFALTVNLVSAIAFVLTARRLKGDVFALIVAVVLAVYETGPPTFQLAEIWNPILPMLPLGLFFLLAVRLGLGDLRVLPAMAFVGTCVVQSHLAYVPATLTVLATSTLLFVAHRLGKTRGHSSGDGQLGPSLAVLLAAAGLSALLWWAPIYENLKPQGGNLRALAEFFVTPPAARQTWSSALESVAQQLAVTPIAFVSLVHRWPSVAAGPVVIAIASAEAVALVGVIVAARRRDPVSTTMATLALAGVAASILAVKAIRGPILPYLVSWISVVGLLAFMSVVGAILPWFERRARGRSRALGLTLGALCVALSVRAQATGSIFPEHDADAEIVVPRLRQFLQTREIAPILVITNRPHPWPVATAIALDLYKHRIPFFVDEGWRFMMGHQFELDGGHHPHLYIGDGAFDRYASARPDLIRIATASDNCAYLEDPAYLLKHRSSTRAVLVGAGATVGDPRVAVDGLTPVESTAWDGSWSVVLDSERSFVTVAAPKRPLAGILLSVAGDAGYAVDCLDPNGSASLLGTTAADERESGMRTRLVFSNLIHTCAAIRVRPRERDGRHSLAEIGFLEE